MTPLDTTAARLEGLLERATKGDWAHLDPVGMDLYARVRGTRLGCRFKIANVLFAADDPFEIAEAQANAALIVAMKNALPALLSERRALKDECERLRAIIAEAVPIIDQIKADVLRPPSRDSQDRRVERAAMWLVKGAQFTANGGEHD